MDVDEVEPGTVLLQGPLADRGAWRATRCSIDRALTVVGTRSALLLMREAYYGTRRFDDFAERVGITEAVAANRLRELVAAGLLERRPYREPGQRTRHEYVLTAMGRDLAPAALALMQWGDKYLADSSGPPLALTHDGCGAPVHVEVRCEQGHEVPLRETSVDVARAKRAPRVPAAGRDDQR
jgi:DNA-binding HxlR family transcriptional regulator